ncbi:hypothetical protein [Amycolatopsis sp. CA-230715]|uniref:hypothetical protein n=1 Tax=Amycolatopsis sp. CA-230715 TaxID=2745196 RepID=UPI0020B17CEC|nr:hypothetical protein [Amycolatopsis sp. CA-230715]
MSVPDGRVTTVFGGAAPFPDGVAVLDGVVYWTTMGVPTRASAKTRESGLDYSRPNGGLHAVGLDGTGARDLLPPGAITTGKQLVSDGAGTLYWSDREGCRVSRVRVDGTELTDLVVNARDSSWRQECVGVAVDTEYLYWTQKGPAKGGHGRIFRAGLDIPAGERADRRSDAEVLWDGLPEPIDLEIRDGWLYWTDRGAEPDGNTLNRAPLRAAGEKPQILARGFREAIGLAVDDEIAYVSDLGGRIRSVFLGGGESRVLAELREPVSGITGVHE